MNLQKLNSATKYPSIPTYHTLDKRTGLLTEPAIQFENGKIVGTEKINGTNARIILPPYGKSRNYLIGSREELLYACDDLVHNAALGIVDTLRPIADMLPVNESDDTIEVLFGEVYGGNLSKESRNYTDSKQVGFRLFDVAWIDVRVLERTREEIASWRDGGGQYWISEDELGGIADEYDLQLVPRLFTVDSVPTGIDEMVEFLENYRTTLAPLDKAGKSEGIVLRSYARRTIAKARFEDYERTLRRRGEQR